MPKAIDITGNRYGLLVVLERTEHKQGHVALWKCLCDCGNYSYTQAGSLKSGRTMSCGCLNRQINKQLISRNLGQVEQTNLSLIASKKVRVDSTSGVRGVKFHKKSGKWMARIGLQKKEHYLGLFDTIEEAAKARARAEEEIFGPILERYKQC